MERIINIEFIEKYRIKVLYMDGFEKTIDIEPFLKEGISKELVDWNYFLQAAIESGGGICWPNGFDFCPEFIRNNI